MKKQFITYAIVTSMLGSACSRNGASGPGDANAQVAEATTGWTQFQALVGAEHGNLPLAEALLHLLQEKNPEAVLALREQMNSGESLLIDQATDDNWNAAKRNLILNGSSAQEDASFYSRTLNLNPQEIERSEAFNHQLSIKIAGVAQSLALKNLLKTFDEQMKKDSAAIAAELVTKINLEQPKILEKIDGTKGMGNRAAQIEKIIIYLKQADYVLANYSFSASDEEKLLVYTAVGASLAATLATQPSVKVLITNLQEVADVVAKMKKVLGLAQTLEKYGKSLANDAKVMGSSAKNIYDKIKGISDLDISLSPEGKKSLHSLMDNFLNGSAIQSIPANLPPELEKTGFFEKKRELDADVDKFISSATNASNSLSNIISITQDISSAMGIKIDPSVQKAMNTAMAISKGVQAVGAISKAFQAGGMVSALAAFSGGPATMALAAFGGMGGGPDPAIMGELANIKASLNEIKEMQKEILENQKKMMVMIKDLALMMQDYHREEMMALTDIRNEVAGAKGGITSLDEKALDSCLAMTSFALNKSEYGTDAEGHRNKYIYNFNVNNIDLIRATIQEMTGDQKNLQQFISNGSPENFKSCQQELSTVFMVKDSSNRKFDRAVWAEKDAEGQTIKDGSAIAEKYYLPALNYLKAMTSQKEQRWEKLGLHLPVISVQDLIARKNYYLAQSKSSSVSTLSALQNLTATNRLEKYVTGLLMLYPYTTIDQPVWNSSLEEILKVGVLPETQERSKQMLSSALERVQVAIAQEALLSGEPLLESLYMNWDKIIQEQQSCAVPQPEGFCFVRSNPLLMGNLLTYAIAKRTGMPMSDTTDAIEQRKQIYAGLKANLHLMAQMLGVTDARLATNEKGETILWLNEDKNMGITLPSAMTIGFGQIQYTDAMLRMIKLEHKVADELLKISSTGYQQQAHAKIAATLFLK